MAEVYVATQTLGVYYSDDFTPAGTMPTWTAVNTGLPNTAVYQAAMDPHDNALYVLLNNPRNVYKLVSGTWESFITNDYARTLTAATANIHYVTFDPSIPDAVYVVVWTEGITGAVGAGCYILKDRKSGG